MKKTLLASAALMLWLSGAASASPLMNLDTSKLQAHATGIQLAKNGSDDGGDHDSGDDHGGGGNSGSGSSNSGHGSANSGHGNADDADDSDDDSDDADDADDDVRTPGGSGCDSAEDIAEHSECSAAQ